MFRVWGAFRVSDLRYTAPKYHTSSSSAYNLPKKGTQVIGPCMVFEDPEMEHGCAWSDFKGQAF